MRTITLLLPLIVATATAQTTWNVEVGGSTSPGQTDPYYSPQDLTIQVGDIVHWSNVNGTHNVNGTQTTFPSNPESFTSGSTQNGSWTYDHTFMIPGVYDYHCDSQNHAATQFGTIIVQGATGIEQFTLPPALSIYPDPAGDELHVALNGCTGAMGVRIVDVNGRTMSEHAVQDARVNHFDLTGFPAGPYYLFVTGTAGRRPVIGRFMKN
ncbi:MAG: hypothetical protein H6594_06645 [Flavobacteriales bacterium]|nr:hypothetical protein [Flavobacteriales bacterium]